MKLKYYGTAAAEGIPALYCSCDTCIYCKKAGGKNVRTRSQALVNGRLLIDMPPDTLYHYQHLGLPLDDINHVLITHRHADHLHTPTINVRCKGYVMHEISDFHIYGSSSTTEYISNELTNGGFIGRGVWNLYELTPYQNRLIDGFEVVPYKANHDTKIAPYVYEIFDGEKRMLYGHDTGYFLDETWEYLEKNKPYFNLISLDCTMGIAESIGHAHMNVDDCVRVKERLLEIGCADKNTVFVLNHFSHNGHISYDELVPVAKQVGFVVSYDGMEIEF